LSFIKKKNGVSTLQSEYNMTLIGQKLQKVYTI